MNEQTKYVDASKIMEITGWCRNTLRRKIKEHNFPFIFDGGRYKFDLKKVETWMKERSVAA